MSYMATSVSVNEEFDELCLGDVVYNISDIAYFQLKPISNTNTSNWRMVMMFDIKGNQIAKPSGIPYCYPDVIKTLKEKLPDKFQW